MWFTLFQTLFKIISGHWCPVYLLLQAFAAHRRTLGLCASSVWEYFNMFQYIGNPKTFPGNPSETYRNPVWRLLGQDSASSVRLVLQLPCSCDPIFLVWFCVLVSILQVNAVPEPNSLTGHDGRMICVCHAPSRAYCFLCIIFADMYHLRWYASSSLIPKIFWNTYEYLKPISCNCHGKYGNGCGQRKKTWW